MGKLICRADAVRCLNGPEQVVEHILYIIFYIYVKPGTTIESGNHNFMVLIPFQDDGYIFILTSLIEDMLCLKNTIVYISIQCQDRPVILFRMVF